MVAQSLGQGQNFGFFLLNELLFPRLDGFDDIERFIMIAKFLVKTGDVKLKLRIVLKLIRNLAKRRDSIVLLVLPILKRRQQHLFVN